MTDSYESESVLLSARLASGLVGQRRSAVMLASESRNDSGWAHSVRPRSAVVLVVSYQVKYDELLLWLSLLDEAKRDIRNITKHTVSPQSEREKHVSKTFKKR